MKKKIDLKIKKNTNIVNLIKKNKLINISQFQSG
jgi:hypothetical protein